MPKPTWEERRQDDVSDLGEHPGYLGCFTKNESEGAYLNGTRIKKVLSERDDATQNGTLGTVLGSVSTDDPNAGFFYFVEWDDKPHYAIGVTGIKIGLEKDPIQGFIEGEQDA